MDKPERSIYTPQDFEQWRAASALELTPKFQRRGVWTPAARSFFIDTLLRAMPVPPIYIRIVQAANGRGIVRQVIDGQQRVSAIMDFIDGKYRLSKTLQMEWANKTFAQLPSVQQEQLMRYSFSAEVFQGVSDLEVLEVFARLNLYSVPLNKQELRNGRFFGAFKQAAYRLAHEHLEFWRRNRIFTERNIARMLEVELVGELLIAQLHGMQDKKNSLDEYYAAYEESLPEEHTLLKRFRGTIDVIVDTLGEFLASSEFRRPLLFYSLFCTIYHRQHGLPGEQTPTPKARITKAEKLELRETVETLSAVVNEGRTEDVVPKKYARFVAASLGQTDNIKPRQDRFRAIYLNAFGG